MSENGHKMMAEVVDLEREKWLHEDPDEPDFPEPYRTIWRNYVADMEAEMAVLPGMGTLAKILIRLVSRDYVASLMVDRRDSTEAEIKCKNCGLRHFVPFWPPKDSRLIRSAKELLAQAGRADLEHALRTEFVLGLVREVTDMIEREVENPAERIVLKEKARATFKNYLEQGRASQRIS